MKNQKTTTAAITENAADITQTTQTDESVGTAVAVDTAGNPLREADIMLAPAQADENADASAEALPDKKKPSAGKKKAPAIREEIFELRETNKKVYRLKNNMQQAVFYASAVHAFDREQQAYVESPGILASSEDGHRFTCDKKDFVASFNREENSDELFCIQKGDYRLTVSARKNRKNRKAILPRLLPDADGTAARRLSYENEESGADYQYSVEDTGVKETIVIREKADTYRYPFLLCCENLSPKTDSATGRVSFVSRTTGEEVFFIPPPFISDANGEVSYAVTYELKEGKNGVLCLSVLADSDFINAPERAFPVIIDPQVQVSGSSYMPSYSWSGKTLSGDTLHTVGTVGHPTSNAARMYMTLNLPVLPRNPRIIKAELIFSQYSGTAVTDELPLFGLFKVEGTLAAGATAPAAAELPLDYAKMKTGTPQEGEAITYSFDVTSLVDMAAKGETDTVNVVLKMLDETQVYKNVVTLYGSSYGGACAPKLVVTYSTSYGVDGVSRVCTHQLGRFGQGKVDLQSGNLMFVSEDFSWAGNRMPVSIRHLYNSALADINYTANTSRQLNTASFSAMRIGRGIKLNLMQSMMAANFRLDASICAGYIYIDESGEETYFTESKKSVCCDSNTQCYQLYEDTNGGSMLYDPIKRTLTQGGDIRLFDESGRLIRISDASGNHTDITYTSGRITSVTDGAGREFRFVYSDSFLQSVTAPDGSKITYAYTSLGYLSDITYYQDEQADRKVSITYVQNKPETVTLKDANGQPLYRVAYTFSGDRLTSFTEYGAENGTLIAGTTTAFDYSAAASKTVVTTTQPADEGETEGEQTKTVYTFDGDGNVISEYMYTPDTGNAGTDGASGEEGSGLLPSSVNLLTDHGFEMLTDWSEIPCNDENLIINGSHVGTHAECFGKKALYMNSRTPLSTQNGVYQTTATLPAGPYTFSVYCRVASSFVGADTAGAYIRVTDTAGHVLAVSEHLTAADAAYVRLSASFRLDTAQSVQVQILLDGQGSAYVDAAQLERSPCANAYNMLENGNFELNSPAWVCGNGVQITEDEKFNMSRSLRISGNIGTQRNAMQNINACITRNTRETFTLSGWAKGYGLPDHEREGVDTPPVFRLRAVIKYYDTICKEYGEETYTADFSPCTEEWQYASVQFAKSKCCVVSLVRIYCDYDYNVGNAYFDDIQLVRNGVEKNLSATDFSAGNTDTVADTATEDDLEETDTAPAFSEATDAYGNALTETTFTDGKFGTIYRSFGYNEDDGNDLVRETDARGNTTTYTVNGTTSRNEEVTDRCGNKTAYEYDDAGRTTKVTSKDASGAPLAHVSYTYDAFDNMTGILRGDNMKYVLSYNAFHNLQSIGIDGKPEKLISYTYKNGNGRLKQVTYANGHTMKAAYNALGQMTDEKWFASEAQAADADAVPMAHYKYTYDGQGNIVRSLDISAQKEYSYEYEQGNIVRAAECQVTLTDGIVTAKTLLNTVRYEYDAEGKLTKKVVLPANGTAQTTYFETDKDNNTVVRFEVPAPTEADPNGKQTVTCHSESDSFGRKVFDELQLGTGFVSRQFSYHAGAVTDEHKANAKLKSSATTQLVSQIILSDGTTLSYTYDNEERIASVTETRTENGEPVVTTTLYTYDALGQLLTETVNGEVVNTMTYDAYGNITSRNGKTYTYGNAVWRDLLTAYNGQSIDYDFQGNPTSYLGHTLTWEKGRQLKSFDNNTYTYNANGIRTGKTVNGVKHTYTLEGTKILCEAWGDNTLVPLYDNEDSVCGILYNNTPYYFIKNLQGDIIAIVDKDAETIARYAYDAWGSCKAYTPDGTENTEANFIGNINPFRYRGYYYDAEIGENGMYYLQSRYYDPAVGRFLNEDGVECLAPRRESILTNMFAYCKNNCVNILDDTGYGVIDALLWALQYAIDVLSKMIELICSTFNKEVESLSKIVVMSKKTRKRYNDLVSLQNQMKKTTKVLNKIGFFVIFIGLIYGCISACISSGDIFYYSVECLVNAFIEGLKCIIGKLFDRLLRLIPYVGFVIGMISGWMIDRAFNRFFDKKCVTRITSRVKSSLEGSMASIRDWISCIIRNLCA